MLPLFYKLPKNVIKIFKGWNLLWMLFAFALTFIVVQTGFDWFWFTHTQSALLRKIFFPAVIIGGQLPIILPLVLLAIGKFRKNFKLQNIAWGIGQAAILGLAISSFFKAFTGRIQPPRNLNLATALDISRGFRFGILRGGVFWGWPSSHATVSFAVAFALLTLLPERKWIRYISIAYAFYVAIGVSMNIHWLSESLAGVIIGSLIGIVVGNSFRNRK